MQAFCCIATGVYGESWSKVSVHKMYNSLFCVCVGGGGGGGRGEVVDFYNFSLLLTFRIPQ